MASPGFLSTGPATANQQLWQRLPGKYDLWRQLYHDEIINGETFAHRDIIPSPVGKSEIIPRTPTDAAYQAELLDSFALVFKTPSGKETIKIEERVFRLQNGEWSVWHADGNGVVTGKWADLTLAKKIKKPKDLGGTWCSQDAHFKARWIDEKGANELFLDFYIASEGEQWSLQHKLDWRVGGLTWQVDYYKPEESGVQVVAADDGCGAGG